jgi:hypothetical protein
MRINLLGTCISGRLGLNSMIQGKAVPLHIMKKQRRSRYVVPRILNASIRGDDRSNLQYSRFTLRKNIPVCIKKRLGGPQARLDVLEKRKSLSTATNQTTSHPVSSPVTLPLMFGRHREQYTVLSPPLS